MLTVLDLFSGIGGISLGLESTGGFRTVAFCEIEAFPRAVLRKHWPEVPIHEDVRTLRGRPGDADVICGGFPCVDISSAGKKVCINGSRASEWPNPPEDVGVDDGLPGRMDRLSALGNSVVPAVVHAIGQAILEAEGLA